MSFSTVAGPNLGQHPTFDPGSSLLWELSTLKVAQGGRRPTAVLNAIGPTALMALSCSIRGSVSAWESWWVAAESEQCEGDERLGSVEPEGDPGE